MMFPNESEQTRSIADKNKFIQLVEKAKAENRVTTSLDNTSPPTADRTDVYKDTRIESDDFKEQANILSSVDPNQRFMPQ